VSTAAILVRYAYTASEMTVASLGFTLAAFRVGFAALGMSPLLLRFRAPRTASRDARYIWLAGLFLATHFACVVPAFALTSIAAATTIIASSPMWVVVILWVWQGEVPSHSTLTGIVVALAGGALIALGGAPESADGASNPLFGNLLALAAAVSYSLYFLLGREAQRGGLPLWRYSVLVYGVASLLLLPLAALSWSRDLPPTGMIVLIGTLLALGPQIVGHTAFNWSVRWISPTLVTLVILFEPIVSGGLAYVIFAEFPGWLTLAGVPVLLGGVVLVVAGSSPPPARAEE
jgi:drug/metabolite transporter (DMT)-like permease